MIIYGRILEKNSPSSVTRLMIIYGHLWRLRERAPAGDS
jgi:hypothetical protein